MCESLEFFVKPCTVTKTLMQVVHDRAAHDKSALVGGSQVKQTKTCLK